MSAFARMCSLFCCPPIPSKIASKLAFAPPEASYHIVKENNTCSLVLKDVADWQYSEADQSHIDGFYTRTKRGNKIACFYVRCSESAQYTILFSHGNAVDMGHMSSFYFGIGHWLNCNVFSYDYSGYGASDGRPSEKNIYADIEAAWSALTTKYNVKTENIILYGQSIGTVPTVDLAARIQVAAVILHSALMSGFRILCPNATRTWFFDVFPNIDKVQKITAPTLVIHGKQDSIVDISHGLKIYEKCQRAVEPLWVDGAGHDDLDCRCGAYLERLRAFINHELISS